MVFLVLEGLDGTGKSTVAKALAARLDAVMLRSPPNLVHTPGLTGTADGDTLPSLGSLRQHFDARSPTVRRAYYRAAGLVSSELALQALQQGRHVVMDRYWASTAAFAAMDRPPPKGDFAAGEYPPEFAKPDAVLLLTVSEQERVRRMRTGRDARTEEEDRLEEQSESRAAVLQAYRLFNVLEVDTTDMTVEQVVEHCLALLPASSEPL